MDVRTEVDLMTAEQQRLFWVLVKVYLWHRYLRIPAVVLAVVCAILAGLTTPWMSLPALLLLVLSWSVWPWVSLTRWIFGLVNN